MKELAATARQCRLALRIASERAKGGTYTTEDAAWDLLEVLGLVPSEQDDFDDDGLEPDNGSDANEGKAMRIFTDALDWQAKMILHRYVLLSRQGLEMGKRLKDSVKLSQRGIVK